MAASTVWMDGRDGLAWALLDAAPDGMVVVDGAGTIVHANRQAELLFGYDAGGLAGTSVDLLLPAELRARHRAHRTRYGAAPATREMGSDLDLSGVRRDGSRFHAQISLSPLALGDESLVIAAVRDVSDHVAAEAHLHRVVHSLDATDDAIMIFDAETLRFSHVNDGAVRMLGYDRTELDRMTPVHLNPHATEADYRSLVEALRSDSTASVRRQSLLLAKDGHEVPVEKLYQAAGDTDDGVQWVIGVARDIGARLAAEAELERSREELSLAKQDAVVADDRTRIARDLHDTVIQRLFGAGLRLQSAASVADDRVATRVNEAIDEIDTAIRELRSAIFSLQDTARPTVGLRGRLLEVLRESSDATGIDPRLRFDGPIDALDERIAEQLVPVLREALSNAARHARAGVVRVTVSAGDVVDLRVTDAGVGPAGDVVGGCGLENLAARARQLGGTSELVPLESGGAELRWTVPASPEEADAEAVGP
jgi:PAS domain S-box-containing protein